MCECGCVCVSECASVSVSMCVCVSVSVCGGRLARLTLLFVLLSPLRPRSEDGAVERSSPKPEVSEPPEEKVTARAGASCPSGGHVADIYLANINK